MNHNKTITSIADAGREISRLSEQHWDRYLRTMMRRKAPESNSRFVSVITGAPHPFGNMALVQDPTDATSAVTAMQQLIDSKAPAVLMFVGRVAESMATMVSGHGFAPHGSMKAMAVDIDRLPHIELADGSSFIRIGAGSASRQWAACFVQGFEFPAILGEAFSPEVVGPDPAPDATIQFFAIERNGQFVSTSALLLQDGVAGLYCIATVPAARGQGFAAFATTATLRHAQSLGYSVGVLQATEAGHPLYRRLGFQDVGDIPLFVRMPVA